MQKKIFLFIFRSNCHRISLNNMNEDRKKERKTSNRRRQSAQCSVFRKNVFIGAAYFLCPVAIKKSNLSGYWMCTICKRFYISYLQIMWRYARRCEFDLYGHGGKESGGIFSISFAQSKKFPEPQLIYQRIFYFLMGWSWFAYVLFFYFFSKSHKMSTELEKWTIMPKSNQIKPKLHTYARIRTFQNEIGIDDCVRFNISVTLCQTLWSFETLSAY